MTKEELTIDIKIVDKNVGPIRPGRCRKKSRFRPIGLSNVNNVYLTRPIGLMYMLSVS